MNTDSSLVRKHQLYLKNIFYHDKKNFMFISNMSDKFNVNVNLIKKLDQTLERLYSIIKNEKFKQLKDINLKKKNFENFYKIYNGIMTILKSFLNLLEEWSGIPGINKQKKEELRLQINSLRTKIIFYNNRKKEIDLVLLGEENSAFLNISSFEEKTKANNIQNDNKNDINEISKQLEFFYESITKNADPSKEFFSEFYDFYIKLMRKLDRIINPQSKNDIDKIKKGLIAKKLIIDKLLISHSNRTLKNRKRFANSLTPKNLAINNLNRIILPHPPQIKSSNTFDPSNFNEKKKLEELQFKNKFYILNLEEKNILQRLSNKKKLKEFPPPPPPLPQKNNNKFDHPNFNFKELLLKRNTSMLNLKEEKILKRLMKEKLEELLLKRKYSELSPKEESNLKTLMMEERNMQERILQDLLNENLNTGAGVSYT